MRAKTVAVVVFCSFIFVFIGWFWLICNFVSSKSFRKKKINKQAWNCLNSLISLYYWRVLLLTYLSRIYLYALIFICDHLWESLLFSWEIFLNPFYPWESLLFMKIFLNPFYPWEFLLFMKVFLNPFYPWESLLFMKIFWNPFYLWEFLLFMKIFFICENLFYYMRTLFCVRIYVFMKISQRMNSII